MQKQKRFKFGAFLLKTSRFWGIIPLAGRSAPRLEERSGSAEELLFCQNKPERAPVERDRRKSSAEGNVLE
ncbi:MAG: hypothetical protein PUK24_04060 [Elusimicrobia bacterium]|nr:hypothetical protein [Elusimicrobiota bacterium]MDY6039025.1 hypothetical protein [Elusimicrobiaceae bacterium]